MTPGATSQAVQVLFEAVQAILEPHSWKTFEADGRNSAWKLLSAPPPGFGCAVVGVEGERVVQQSFRSCVVEATFSVRLASNLPPNPNGMPRQAGVLREMADAVKTALLAATLPRDIVPEAPAVAFRYGGAAPFQPPPGQLLDAIEQTWKAELKTDLTKQPQPQE